MLLFPIVTAPKLVDWLLNPKEKEFKAVACEFTPPEKAFSPFP